MSTMRALSASHIIDIWERAAGQPPVDQALTLLGAACPELDSEQLAALAIGRRDGCLMRLREDIFGPNLNGSARCPRCNEALEFTLITADLAVGAPSDCEEPYELVKGEILVRFRLPNSTDLRAIAHSGDAGAARALLLERCVVAASRGGCPLSCETLPENIAVELAAHVAEIDPLADIALDMNCAHCGHLWSVVLDIAAFLWIEIDMLAKRLMAEVHALAGAYGWSEADILTMGARRRHFYLEMAG
jgi:hypothetical protein